MNEVLKEKFKGIDIEYVDNIFKNELIYYVRHFNLENENPFIKKFVQENHNNWIFIKKILEDLNKKVLDGDEIRKKTICFLEKKIEEKLTNKQKLIIEIPYIKEDEISIFNKYNPVILFIYTSIELCLKIIKKRNLLAIKLNKPLEYRHPIYVINSILNYYQNKNGKIIEIIDEEKLSQIIKEIHSIDQYSSGYHKKQFKDINILNQFKTPIKLALNSSQYFEYENEEN